jgi:hypothetical protein
MLLRISDLKHVVIVLVTMVVMMDILTFELLEGL